jgi:hypothetical protein
MLNLTKQQQFVLCAVLFLFLTGLAVKAWRAGHPRVQAAQTDVR